MEFFGNQKSKTPYVVVEKTVLLLVFESMWGISLDQRITESGDYLLPLLGDAEEANIAWVFAINLENISEQEKLKQMKKLHNQFGHTPRDKFIRFMNHANVWNDSLEKPLDTV